MDETDLWILSYDVDGRDRSTASRVCHIVFGRKNRTTLDGSPTSYDQPGFFHRPGVVWAGQPGLILPRHDPLELRGRLGEGGVCRGWGRLWRERAKLTVFSRARRPAPTRPAGV